MYEKIVLKYEDIKINSSSTGDFPSVEMPESGGVEMTGLADSINPDLDFPEIDSPEIDIPEIEQPIVQPTKIKKGTYVEYHNNPDNPDDYEVYQVNVDCTTSNWKDYACKLAVDPRGCIVYILEHSCNMDMNLMSSIDRNIKEALVNYIIYKWFEYTNPQEAQIFYLKYEDYGREAKIGMDSEKKILQRNYKLF
jgi:hypothetical protein